MAAAWIGASMKEFQSQHPPGASHAGLVGSRRGLVAGVRVTARLVELLEGQGSSLARAFPLVSLAGDLRLWSRLGDPRWWPGWAQWSWDALDVAARSILGAPSSATLPAVVADMIPTGIMSGVQATAGRTAVPVIPDAPAWPPRSPGEALRVTGQALAPVIAAAAGYAVGERVRGRRARIGAVAQVGVVTTGVALTLARHRDRTQAAIRRRHQSSIDRDVARERQVMHLHARTAPTVGHDFAKTLIALGELGDAACAEAGRVALDIPRALVEDQHDGCTLRALIGGLPVHPEDAGRYWIPGSEVSRLEAEMAKAAATARDGADQTVYVKHVSARRVELEWLGSEIVVQRDPIAVTDRFYPTSAAFLVGANYKLLPVLSGTPLGAAAAGAAIDVAATWVNRHPTVSHRSWSPLAWSIASTAVQTVLVSGRSGAGSGLGPSIPATSNCTGASLLWSSHWGRLTAAQRVAAGVPAACWLVTMARAGPVGWRRWAIEACYLLMPAAAAWRLTDHLDEEADALAAALHTQLDDAAIEARAAASAEVLAEYRGSLALARAGLDRLGDEIPEAVRDQVVSECLELAEWIDAIDGAPSTSAAVLFAGG